MATAIISTHHFGPNIDNNNKISEDKNSKLNIKLSQIDRKDNEIIEKNKDKSTSDISKESISEKKIKDLKNETKHKKTNGKKSSIIKMIFIFLIILIVSFLGLILLLDTFKSYLISEFPTITPLFDSFYETFLDFKLFVKDLAN